MKSLVLLSLFASLAANADQARNFNLKCDQGAAVQNVDYGGHAMGPWYTTRTRTMATQVVTPNGPGMKMVETQGQNFQTGSDGQEYLVNTYSARRQTQTVQIQSGMMREISDVSLHYINTNGTSYDRSEHTEKDFAIMSTGAKRLMSERDNGMDVNLRGVNYQEIPSADGSWSSSQEISGPIDTQQPDGSILRILNSQTICSSTLIN